MNRFALAILLGTVFSIPAYAQDAKISALPAAGALSGTELTPVVKSGVTSQSTAQAQANLATGASGTAISSVTGDVTGTGPGATATTIAANAVTNAKAAQGGANTVKGNFTGSTANEADNAMPSCSGANQALKYTSNTGIGCVTISAGGSVTLTAGGGTQTAVTTIAFGNCFTTPNGSSGTAPVNTTIQSITKTASYTTLATDMCGSLILAATSLTPVLTLDTATATMWAPGMSLTVTVPKITSGVNWTVTNSTGLTMRGLNSTTLLPGTSITFLVNNDGVTLDAIPGMQVGTTTALGGYMVDGTTITVTNGVITAVTGGIGCTLPGTVGLMFATAIACTVDADVTVSSHTITFAAATILDMSAMSVTAGLKIPASAGAAPTADDFIAFDTTAHTLVFGANGSTGKAATLNLKQKYTAPQAGTPVNVAISTATFTANFDTTQNFEIDLTSACPCTLANPSGTLVAGTSGMIEVHQDGTGSRTLGTYGSQYQYAGGTSTIVLSTAASSIDYLPYYVNNAATAIILGGIIKGPAH